MSRLHQAIAIGLAAAALASCARSGADPSALPAGPSARSDAAGSDALVVTGTRVAGNAEAAYQPAPVASVPQAVSAPPPPPPAMALSSRMAPNMPYPVAEPRF